MAAATSIDFWLSIASADTHLSVSRIAEVARSAGADIRRRPFKVRAPAGLTNMSSVGRDALKVRIEHESARRLVRLGGSEPGSAPSPRRRAP